MFEVDVKNMVEERGWRTYVWIVWIKILYN